jgi:Fic family protein
MPSFDPAKPCDELPPLPPAEELENRAVLKACIAARAALAELNQATELLPNQAVLLNTFPLLEALASSEIENIATSADSLFRFAQPDREVLADAATQEVLRYRTALVRGAEYLRRRPLGTATAVDVCSTLLGVQLDIRRDQGVALVNHLTGEVMYTPPQGEAVLRRLLANWESLLHGAEDLDPLVRMAVAHFLFAAIQPFTAGNGRTSRILSLLFIVEQGLLQLPILCLSRGILRRKVDYYWLLRAIASEGGWERRILHLVGAVEQTARWTTALIRSIRQLAGDLDEQLRREAHGVYSPELVELICVQPHCRIRNLVAAGIARRQTAAIYLKKLSDLGVLEEVRAGRDKLFVNRGLMRLLAAEGPAVVAFPVGD